MTVDGKVCAGRCESEQRASDERTTFRAKDRARSPVRKEIAAERISSDELTSYARVTIQRQGVGQSYLALYNKHTVEDTA